jgi:hypothetical protein
MSLRRLKLSIYEVVTPREEDIVNYFKLNRLALAGYVVHMNNDRTMSTFTNN